jgi:hypothetical protein
MADSRKPKAGVAAAALPLVGGGVKLGRSSS